VQITENHGKTIDIVTVEKCEIPKRSRRYIEVCPTSEIEAGEYWIENEGNGIDPQIRATRGVIKLSSDGTPLIKRKF
jgi:hypothetical protein